MGSRHPHVRYYGQRVCIRFFTAASFALLACSGADPLAPTFDAEVLLRVEVSESALADNPVTEVGVRAWDENHRLLLDELADVNDYEDGRFFRLFPDPENSADPSLRVGRIEFELFDRRMCPRGRATRTFRFREGQIRAELTLEDDPRFANCRAVFASREGAGLTCSRETPCTDPWRAVSRAHSERGEALNDELIIAYIAGGTQVGATDLPARARRIFRAWPGTVLKDNAGPPTLSGEAVAQDGTTRATVVNFRGHQLLELDGLHFEAGAERAVAMLAAVEGRVRNCSFAGRAASPSLELSPSGRESRDAERGVLIAEHNFFEGGASAIEVRAGDGRWQVQLVANRIRGAGTGLVVQDLSAALEVRANTFCEVATEGVRIGPSGDPGPIAIAHNAFIDGTTGLHAADHAPLTLSFNTFQGQSGSSLQLEGASDAASLNANLFERLPPGAEGNAEGRVAREECTLGTDERGGVCTNFPDCP